MYQSIGYYKLDDNEVILRMAAYLREKGTFQSTLNELEKLLLKHGKRWYKFTMPQIAAITADAANDPAMRALTHLFMHMLKAAGRLDETVPVVTYRNNPSLTVDEVTSRIAALDVTWPILPPLPQLIQNSELKVALQYAYNHLEQLVLMRPAIVERLREYARHIRWMVKMGRELSQEEKTFYLHMNDPKYGVSKFLKETTLPKATLETPNEMRSLDPMAVLAKLRQVTEPGPQIDYLAQFSNTNLEDLVTYAGAYVPSLIVAAGYRTQLGLFETLNLEVIDNISWQPDEQLRGSLEAGVPAHTKRSMAFKNGKHSSYMDQIFPKLRITRDTSAITAQGIHLLPDLPDIKLIWRKNQVMYSFYSGWRKRTMEGVDTSDYWVSSALTSAQIGQAKHADLSLDRWGIVDTSELTQAKTPYSKDIFKQYSETMEAWHVKRGRKKLNESKVDMEPFMLHYGRDIVKPALSEFYRPNRDLLFQENPDAMRYLRSRLGLTDTEYLRSKLPLQISFNVWRLKSLFKTLPATDAVDDEAVKKMKELALAVLKGG